MNVVILSPVRLLGEGLASCFSGGEIVITAVVNRFGGLREALARAPTDVVLIDVSQNIALDEVRAIAIGWPGTALVAVGLDQQDQAVIRCGRAGFVGYVEREGTLEQLQRVLAEVGSGRMSCPAEVSGELMRALFHVVAPAAQASRDEALTRREEDVLRLIGNGLSNKEIARELTLSVATVKQHVHHILGKLHLSGRAQAMRRVRDEPWIAS